MNTMSSNFWKKFFFFKQISSHADWSAKTCTYNVKTDKRTVWFDGKSIAYNLYTYFRPTLSLLFLIRCACVSLPHTLLSPPPLTPLLLSPSPPSLFSLSLSFSSFAVRRRRPAIVCAIDSSRKQYGPRPCAFGVRAKTDLDELYIRSWFQEIVGKTQKEFGEKTVKLDRPFRRLPQTVSTPRTITTTIVYKY